MGKSSLDNLLDVITNTFLFVIILAAVLAIFSGGKKIDTALIEKMEKKSTVIHTLAYGKEDRYISSEAVVTDIIATTNETIKINGYKLSDEKLSKLRSYDDISIRNIRNDLGNKEYKKVLTFNSEGYVIEINFVERR